MKLGLKASSLLSRIGAGVGQPVPGSIRASLSFAPRPLGVKDREEQADKPNDADDGLSNGRIEPILLKVASGSALIILTPLFAGWGLFDILGGRPHSPIADTATSTVAQRICAPSPLD